MKIQKIHLLTIILITTQKTYARTPHLFERTSETLLTLSHHPHIAPQNTQNHLPSRLLHSSTSNEVAITNNLNPKIDSEYEGSDLRTQLMKSTLDFTDDLSVIIKRVLLQRENLKNSKKLSGISGNQALYAGASYKGYDKTPQENRPHYNLVDIKNQSQQNGLVDEERMLLGLKKLKNFGEKKNFLKKKKK